MRRGLQYGAVKIGKVKILVKAAGKTGGLDVEAKAMAALQDAIMGAMVASGGPITIKMPHRTVSGITGVAKTPGTPNSDFHCLDKNKKPVIFISHKKGKAPTDFQQWGGLTEDAIASNPLVQEFGVAAKAEYGESIPRGESLSADIGNSIEAKNLKMMSVFGVDSLTRKWGVNCVDVVIQGDPGLEATAKGVYKFTASGHVHFYGEIPTGGFEPVLALIYKGDRTNLGIKGARGSIQPKAGRKYKRHITLKGK